MAKVEPKTEEALENNENNENNEQKESSPEEESPDAEKGQSEQPGIQDVNNTTGVLVDELKQKRNKTFAIMTLQSSLGLVTLALDVVGILVKADESCDDQLTPVGWRTWFTVHAALVGAILLVSPLTVYALYLVANEDALTCQVHTAKGKQAEAVQDAQQAVSKTQEGQRLLVRVGCFACLLFVFAFVWLIIGIVVYTNSDTKACDDAKTWFWVLIAMNFALSTISSALKPKKNQQE